MYIKINIIKEMVKLINKNKKLLMCCFLLPLVFLVYVAFATTLGWWQILVGSEIILLMVMIGLKTRIYYRGISIIVSWVCLLGGLIGVGYYIDTWETKFLSYIILYFTYILFANVVIERSMLEHLEYHIKKILNEKYSDVRYDGVAVFKKKVYLNNLRIINGFIIAFGIIGGLLLVITIVCGLDMIGDRNTLSDGLGLLGVGLGILGFLGILMSMESSRNRSKSNVKAFYFIVEKDKNIEFKHKLNDTNMSIITANTIPYLFDLVVRENQKQHIIQQIQTLLESNGTREVVKVIENKENILMKLLRLFMKK